MPGTNQTIGGGGFHHVAINAADFDASHAFWTDVMGCSEKLCWRMGEGDDAPRACMLDVGDGNYVEIFEKPELAGQDIPWPQTGVIHFAIRTTDLDAALQRARDAGCEVTMEPKRVDIPNTCEAAPSPAPVYIAFFKGPSGEVVELFQNDVT